MKQATLAEMEAAWQAAERGVLAGRLAARGYTANASAIDGNQGFAQAAGNGELAQDRHFLPGPVDPPRPAT